MERGYRGKDISRLFGLSEGQVKSWHRSGLVPHLYMEDREPVFGFKELVCFKVLKDLTDKGITPRRIRNYLSQLKRILPESERPLTELKFTIEGGKLLVCKEGQTFDPRGQLHMDFSVKKPKAVVSIDLRRHPALAESERPLTELKFTIEGGKLLVCKEGQTFDPRGQFHMDFSMKKPKAVVSIDRRRHPALADSEYGGENDPEGAIREYTHFLEHDPGDADAMVNLGNIYYGVGDKGNARHWYLEALMADPEHVEGNYNLANLLDEQGEVETAVIFYLRSIGNDANFADAHFNVAICFHKLGKFDQAKRYFKSYLRFDSTSEWAKIALELLNSY